MHFPLASNILHNCAFSCRKGSTCFFVDMSIGNPSRAFLPVKMSSILHKGGSMWPFFASTLWNTGPHTGNQHYFTLVILTVWWHDRTAFFQIVSRWVTGLPVCSCCEGSQCIPYSVNVAPYCRGWIDTVISWKGILTHALRQCMKLNIHECM